MKNAKNDNRIFLAALLKKYTAWEIKFRKRRIYQRPAQQHGLHGGGSQQGSQQQLLLLPNRLPSLQQRISTIIINIQIHWSLPPPQLPPNNPILFHSFPKANAFTNCRIDNKTAFVIYNMRIYFFGALN